VRTVSQVIGDIGAYQPTPDGWLGLDTRLNELFGSPVPEEGIEALLGVLERFPDDDGAGVFWSIVHGLESVPGHEAALVASVRRLPTEFNTLMVQRLLNAGVRNVAGADLLLVLEDARAHPGVSASVAESVGEYIAMHSRVGD
jgi:hypothetical protein